MQIVTETQLLNADVQISLRCHFHRDSNSTIITEHNRDKLDVIVFTRARVPS